MQARFPVRFPQTRATTRRGQLTTFAPWEWKRS